MKRFVALVLLAAPAYAEFPYALLHARVTLGKKPVARVGVSAFLRLVSLKRR